VALAEFPQNYVWVWYKPANMPQGLIVRIPDETFRDCPQPQRLTMRAVLLAAAVEPSCVATWYLYGVAYDGANGKSPYLDRPIPPPAPGMDPNIAVYVDMFSEVFDRIGADWAVCLQLEKHLDSLRKNLVDMAGRLKTLNRDLTFPEMLHSSNQDKKDWQEARRWLRDCSTQLSRYIKEHDVGETIYAGKKKWFEQTYKEYILPHRQFDGLEQAQKEFEMHRKLLQTLEYNMNTAFNYAALNGERRANEILKRIAQKVREASIKKTALGVMLDS
jgi:hypothetical protein